MLKNIYNILYYILILLALFIFINAFIFSSRFVKQTYNKIIYAIIIVYLSIILFLNNKLFSLNCDKNNVFYTNELLLLIVFLPIVIIILNYKFNTFIPTVNVVVTSSIILLLISLIIVYYILFYNSDCSISNDFIVEWGFMKTNKIFLYIFLFLYFVSFYIINSNLLNKTNIKQVLFIIGLSFIISVIFYRWDWIHIFGFILLILYMIKIIINYLLFFFK